MENQPKLSSVEAILMLTGTIIVDLWEMFVAAITAIPIYGWIMAILSVFVALFVLLIFIFWLIMKGISPWWFVAGGGADVIPGISAFPCKTAAMVKIVLQHSELAEDILKVVGKVPLPQAKAAQAALKAAKTAGKITGKA